MSYKKEKIKRKKRLKNILSFLLKSVDFTKNVGYTYRIEGLQNFDQVKNNSYDLFPNSFIGQIFRRSCTYNERLSWEH